jgi:hypothetical protein
MNVDHAAGIGVDEFRRHDPHVAGAGHEFGARCFNQTAEPGIEARAIGKRPGSRTAVATPSAAARLRPGASGRFEMTREIVAGNSRHGWRRSTPPCSTRGREMRIATCRRFIDQDI